MSKVKKDKPSKNGYKVAPTEYVPDHLPFTPAERNIFVFCDHGPRCQCKPGQANCRRVDPMAVLEALNFLIGSELATDMALLNTPIPDDRAAATISPATARLEAAIVGAFKLHPFDDQYGLTRVECLALLYSFWDYISECKKKADALRTSLGLGVPVSFPATISATKPPSASNSTSEGSTAASPPPSASESAPASEPTSRTDSGPTTAAPSGPMWPTP